MQYTLFLGLMWWRFRKFLGFFWAAKTKYAIHNEFIFDFCMKTLEDKQRYYIYGDMIPIEQAYSQNTNLIEVIDFGAGSKALRLNNNTKRKISDIYKNSSSGRKKAMLLSKIVRWHKAKNILEIGSNLGLSSGYLAGTFPSSSFIGLEGCPKLASLANQVLKGLRLKNAKIVTGKFSDTLIPELKKEESFDLIFMDGHHTYDATLDYFEQILQYNSGPCLVVIDDIYWNAEMFKAWDRIKSNLKVNLSVDLYQFGLCWINTDHNIMPKHIRIIKSSFKPFQLM